ncbi:hypothetical protein [Enterovirga sp.]|uniref:hypothetical protein n=1 Tax=Enterovirga sp. TaxID=2026350 RepID=UPI00262C8CE1|nr:hypothetical protein [Enterovirga sp.]
MRLLALTVLRPGTLAQTPWTELAGVDPDSPTWQVPAPRFTGLPRLNFVYGHNDPEQVPARELADCAAKVLAESGHLLGALRRAWRLA